MPLKFEQRPRRALRRRTTTRPRVARTFPRDNFLHCCLSLLFSWGQIVVIDLMSYVLMNNVQKHTMLHVNDRRRQRGGKNKPGRMICCGGGCSISPQLWTATGFAS